MGFRSIRELYKWSSCAVLMHKVENVLCACYMCVCVYTCVLCV